ncbi:MAG TPA: hypothetical protein DDW87_00540 [Firmicutes bacterium]|nr:hypothetical protein [Bacillota bacterium]
MVYTIVDSFTAPDNLLLGLIQEAAWGGAGFGVSTAMSWFYFSMILVVLVLATVLVSRGVHYET